VLEGAQDGVERSLKGKVVESRELKLGSYLGREFTLTLEAGNQYRARIYMVEGRLYQVILLGSKEYVNSLAAKAFLYSFELTD
jgi:hypothetical protein